MWEEIRFWLLQNPLCTVPEMWYTGGRWTTSLNQNCSKDFCKTAKLQQVKRKIASTNYW